MVGRVYGQASPLSILLYNICETYTMLQIDIGDRSAVGQTYTLLEELKSDPLASRYAIAVTQLRFDLYHTVFSNDELYALHEDGVCDGKVICCEVCSRAVDKQVGKMHKLQDKAGCRLFFKFDPTLEVNECVKENNIVSLYPIRDTWPEWDYGKDIRYYVDKDGSTIDFKDLKGNVITCADLSDGEIQALSPLLVANKIIKISSKFDKFIGHKVKGHIMTLPISSSSEIYKTMCPVLPRLDVAEFNRILYLGTRNNYSSRVAFRLNQQRHSLRRTVVECFLKGMRQACEFFAERTRFEHHSDEVWESQVNAYQNDIIAEPQKNIRNIETILRSDVAQGWDTELRMEQCDKTVDAEFTDVMVTEDSSKDPDTQIIDSLLGLHNEMQSKDDCDEQLQIRIKDKPLNEYSNNPEILHLAFPLLFPLGITARQIGSSGLLRQRTVRRLLCSANGRFARSKSLLFLLMNQKMRHDNNMNVALRINANTELSRKFVKFVNSEDFERLCIAAAANPKGKCARILLAKVRPLVAVSGQTTKWSALERSACKGKLFSMAQIFTPSALFVTFAPKALDCDLVVRNAAVQLGMSDCEIISLFNAARLNERVRIVSDNPVAQARAFEHIVRGFCNVILGMERWNERDSREQRIQRKRGIFGTPLAYFGPIETQHRGTLHLHVMVQVAELLPAILQRFAHDDEVIEYFTRQINSVVTGSTRGFEHIDTVARKERSLFRNKREEQDESTTSNKSGPAVAFDNNVCERGKSYVGCVGVTVNHIVDCALLQCVSSECVRV